MSTPSLLSLPAEVRLNIYSHLFDSECLYIDPHTETSQQPPKQQRQLVLAPILRTCRYLRDEAGPSYFSKVNVHFNVHKDAPSTSLIHWLDSIGESNVRLLRSFTMRWENYVDIGLELKRNARAVSNDLPAFTSQMHDLDSCKTAAPIALPSIMLGTEYLFKAPTCNPTISTRVGQKHILTMKGVDSDKEDRRGFWKANGTAEFCDALTRYLSPRIEATLENRGATFMSSRELVEFVDDASRHAGGLRWLWFW